MVAPLKIIVIGDFSVGKTSITRRYVTGAFTDAYRATVGAAILNHKVTLADGSSQPLVLFDLEGGLDRLDKLTPFLRGASGAVVVSDCTELDSIDNLESYVRFLRSALPACPLAFALNKSDLPHPEEVVERHRLRLIAEHDLHPLDGLPSALRTSAATGEGLDQLFAALLTRLGADLAGE